MAGLFSSAARSSGASHDEELANPLSATEGELRSWIAPITDSFGARKSLAKAGMGGAGGARSAQHSVEVLVSRYQ